MSNIKIKANHVPRSQARLNQQQAGGASSSSQQQLALCPNCNQPVPYSELEEHIRIELLDPEWRSQKAIADKRQSSTNLSTGLQAAATLKRLASQRLDIFDAPPVPIANAAGDGWAGSTQRHPDPHLPPSRKVAKTD